MSIIVKRTTSTKRQSVKLRETGQKGIMMSIMTTSLHSNPDRITSAMIFHQIRLDRPRMTVFLAQSFPVCEATDKKDLKAFPLCIL